MQNLVSNAVKYTQRGRILVDVINYLEGGEEGEEGDEGGGGGAGGGGGGQATSRWAAQLERLGTGHAKALR